MNNTKLPEIMATVADNRCEPDFLNSLFGAGATQVRVNSAHVSPDTFARMVGEIRQVRRATAILMDTKGPEIRTTALDSGCESLPITCGRRIRITGNPDEPTTTDTIALSYCPQGLLQPGHHLFIDDGAIDLEVVEPDTGHGAVAVAVNSATLGSRKSVNLPGVDISALPAVTERDAVNLRMAAQLGIDMVAHSFVRSADDVRLVRSILREAGGVNVALYAKIECRMALDNFSHILREADGILVARGDLGMEIPQEFIPPVQQAIIDRAHRAGKPVIVATSFSTV